MDDSTTTTSRAPVDGGTTTSRAPVDDITTTSRASVEGGTTTDRSPHGSGAPAATAPTAASAAVPAPPDRAEEGPPSGPESDLPRPDLTRPDLRQLGLAVGDRVRWRDRKSSRWRDGRVIGIERDGSVGVRDARGASRALRVDRLEVRDRGPRGGVVWEPLPERAARTEQLGLWGDGAPEAPATPA